MGRATKKTMVGLLVSDDDPRMNAQLMRLFNDLYSVPDGSRELRYFQFVCTGSTCQRVFKDDFDYDDGGNENPVETDVADFLRTECSLTYLPDRRNGGIVFLGHLVASRMCSIMWPLLIRRMETPMRQLASCLTVLSVLSAPCTGQVRAPGAARELDTVVLDESTLRVYVIDVGGGFAALIETSSGGHINVDGSKQRGTDCKRWPKLIKITIPRLKRNAMIN